MLVVLEKHGVCTATRSPAADSGRQVRQRDSVSGCELLNQAIFYLERGLLSHVLSQYDRLLRFKVNRCSACGHADTLHHIASCARRCGCKAASGRS